MKKSLLFAVCLLGACSPAKQAFDNISAPTIEPNAAYHYAPAECTRIKTGEKMIGEVVHSSASNEIESWIVKDRNGLTVRVDSDNSSEYTCEETKK